jgi:hypothetical protein
MTPRNFNETRKRIKSGDKLYIDPASKKISDTRETGLSPALNRVLGEGELDGQGVTGFEPADFGLTDSVRSDRASPAN